MDFPGISELYSRPTFDPISQPQVLDLMRFQVSGPVLVVTVSVVVNPCGGAAGEEPGHNLRWLGRTLQKATVVISSKPSGVVFLDGEIRVKPRSAQSVVIRLAPIRLWARIFPVVVQIHPQSNSYLADFTAARRRLGLRFGIPKGR